MSFTFDARIRQRFPFFGRGKPLRLFTILFLSDSSLQRGTICHSDVNACPSVSCDKPLLSRAAWSAQQASPAEPLRGIPAPTSGNPFIFRKTVPRECTGAEAKETAGFRLRELPGCGPEFDRVRLPAAQIRAVGTVSLLPGFPLSSGSGELRKQNQTRARPSHRR